MNRDDHGYEFTPVIGNAADESLPEELRTVAQWYVTRSVPEPTPEASLRLLASLRREELMTVRVHRQDHQPILQTMRMVRWQLYLLGPWFWITSSVLLVLGIGAAPFLPHSVVIALLIYALPLTAVLSAVYALPRVKPGLRDLEKSAPTGFVEMMTGMVLALVCFNVLLGLLATLALSLVHWAAFSTLLVSWLAPLLLLVALSFPVALRWGTLPAMLVGGGPWLLLMLAAVAQSRIFSAGFLLATQSGWLLGLQLCATSLGMLILAVLFLRGSVWQRILLWA
jgi:hypothetical protein